MTKLVSLDAARWNAAANRPGAHKPREALIEALRRIDAGEWAPDHVVVCAGESDGDSSAWHTLQAGSFNGFAQRGLVLTIASEMGVK